MTQSPDPPRNEEPAPDSRPLPTPNNPINLSLPIPILDKLLKFLQEVMVSLGFPPQLAIIILIDTAVLIIGIIILTLLASEQRIQGLIILVVLIVISSSFAYLVSGRDQKKRPKRQKPKS